METHSSALQITRFSRAQDGSLRESWRGVRAYSVSKMCAVCGAEFRPTTGAQVISEVAFRAMKCCGKSCAKKLKNPMHSAYIRTKVSQTLREVGHMPKTQGGNGRGMTAAQRLAVTVLGAGWVPEYIFKTKRKPYEGYPHHYKIDIANESLKVAIEIDGGSHGSLERKAQDTKKDALLRACGWRVLRLRNAEASELFSTFESKDIPRILQMAS